MTLRLDGTPVGCATGGVGLDGDRPPLVLVHGAGMDHTVWQQQTRFLAHHGYRAVAVDLPGHGATPGPPCPSIPDYADWLARATAENQLAPAHLAGHSMGGFVALEMAARHPDLVRSLLLFGVAVSMPVHPDLLGAAEAGEPLAGQLMSGWGLDATARTGLHPTPGQWMVGGVQALLDTGPPGVLANDLAASQAYDQALEFAGKVDCPVTVVIGEHDRMTPPRAAEPLLDALPDPRVVRLTGCGHMMILEQPAEVRQAFLDALSAASA